MKRSKLLVLTTAVLAMLLLFTACGKPASIPLKDVLLKDTTYTDSTPSYTTFEKISDLTGATVGSTSGDLVSFSKVDTGDPTKTKISVYNIATNSIVWSETQTATYSIDVKLNDVNYFYYQSDAGCSYFVVKTIAPNPDDITAKPVTTTTLYSEAGEKIVSVNRSASVENVADLLYLDGKMYRATADGKIAYAFDYSPLANLPDIETKYNGQYYELKEEYVAVYDSNLKFVSKYKLPVHIEDGGVVTACVVLENGNIFVQYVYAADAYSDEYDLIIEGEKYIVVTQLVDVKKGTAKQIDCEYVIDDTMNMIEWADRYKDAGINVEKMPVIGYASRIENKRVANELVVVIDNKGNCKELGTINGNQIDEFEFFADGSWEVYTEGSRYLVDADGKIIGDISNASTFGKFLYADGKIYDAKLNEVYDYYANDLTVKNTVGDSLLLAGEDGLLVLYTGSGDPITLIEKDAKKELVTVSDRWNSGSGYIIIKTGAEQFEIYNDAGTKLDTVNDVIGNSSVGFISAIKNVALVKIYTTYYRFS